LDTDKEEAVLLIEMGRYFLYCLLAEENELREHPEKTEIELMELWDQCNEGQFENLCLDARRTLDEYAHHHTATIVRAAIKKRIEPVKWAINAFNFSWRAILNSIISSISLILIGLLILWLAPNFVKESRSKFDKIMPPSTQPDHYSSRVEKADGK
jgi:hypothetical protein